MVTQSNPQFTANALSSTMTDFTSHKIDLAISTLTSALEFVSSKENEFERLGYAKAAISLALSDLQAIAQVEQ